ncbi:MAG: hypothetical protein OXH69_17000, partial [Acidobacteria bacterium]|nr:hypothetical protein [Acidobacteriota bacterium]
MSSETKWIIGTGIGIIATILTTGVSLAVLMISLISGVNTRIDDVSVGLTARIDDLGGRLERVETDVRSMDDRLRGVEIAFGK